MPDLSLKPWKAFRDDAKADQEAVKEYQNFQKNLMEIINESRKQSNAKRKTNGGVFRRRSR